MVHCIIPRAIFPGTTSGSADVSISDGLDWHVMTRQVNASVRVTPLVTSVASLERLRCRWLLFDSPTWQYLFPCGADTAHGEGREVMTRLTDGRLEKPGLRRRLRR